MSISILIFALHHAWRMAGHIMASSHTSILQHRMLFIYHVGGVGKAAVALATMDHGAGELRTCYAPNIDAMAHVSLERIPRTLYQQQKPTIFIYY
jgi:hypothetical protein